MVKPLVFKGEKRSKKRKIFDVQDSSNVSSEVLDNRAITQSIADESNGDDNWVSAELSSEVAGPIIFILPSTPPACIACDANGKVFVSDIENTIDGDPATAEPHDVRQVWIASRVAGTDSLSFKGHHGRYLSCDQAGVLSASNEAISPEESFLCIQANDLMGTFNIQTQREKYLAIARGTRGPEVRGDADSISSDAIFRIRMHARFRSRLKASKESKGQERITKKELEAVVGRKLEDEELRKLKKARAQGDYHEAILDVRVKGKHDKYA